MEPLHPIFWGQGMFLQPQHFQQQDRYHEARVCRSLHWLAPFAWGINFLVLCAAAL
jgi:type VI secretion system protein ImpJ